MTNNQTTYNIMNRRLLFVLLCGLLTVMAAFCKDYSVTLRDAKPMTVVSALKEATGYGFVYQKDLLNSALGDQRHV